MSKIVYLLYRLSNILFAAGVPVVPKGITLFIRIVFGGWIPAEAKIGKNVRFGKGGLGIVIHEKSVIGDNVIISHNVTVGGSSKKEKGKLPVLGSCVRVGAGAVILGDVTIGSNVVVAANAVVSSSVPENSLVGGNPARVLRENIDINEYVDFGS